MQAEPTHRERLLAEALLKVLIAGGMVRADAAMTGPELLLAAEDFYRAPNAEFHETALAVGAKVDRDDGRFYVPVSREPAIEGVSDIVLRVASDAFAEEGEAERFALTVAMAWNTLFRHHD